MSRRFATTLALLLAACHVEGPAPEPSRELAPYVTAPDEAPVAVAAPEPPDVALAAGLELRPAIRDGRVAVVPIVATAPAAEDPAYLTLQDGMRRGLVTVREMPSFEVGTVRVTNRSQQPLFIASGELIVEAHQDRITAEDRVIEAGASTTIDVRCVELGRDDGGQKFAPGHAIAELSLRKTLLQADQSAVWKEVDRINARRGIDSPTDAYRGSARQLTTAPNPRRDRLAGALASLPERERLVGFAVAVDGTVIAVEHYASPALYRQLEPRLVASYAAIEEDGERLEGGRVTAAAVRQLAAHPSSQSEVSKVALRAPAAAPRVISWD